jgi:hypothetical protein
MHFISVLPIAIDSSSLEFQIKPIGFHGQMFSALFPWQLLMKFSKTVHQIKYQVAKLEVLEIMFLLKERLGGSLDIRLAHSLLSTLRRSLWDCCDTCLEASLDDLEQQRHRLKEMLASANGYLGQMVNGLPAEDPQAVFVREVLVQVISELISLRANLDQPQEENPFQFPVDLDAEFNPSRRADNEVELEIINDMSQQG